MSFLLDGVLPEYPSWRNYFDVVVTGAAKPAFFTERRPLWLLDARRRAAPRGPVAGAGPGLPGRQPADFERLLGIGGDRVLYVGDHIYGDILRSKKSSLWRTCMVVQEIEEELAWLERNRDPLAELSRLEGLRVRMEDEVAVHRAALNAIDRRLERGLAGREELEADRRRNKSELEALRRALRAADARVASLERGVEEGRNPYWGLTFKEGNENSRFGEQVEVYACLYTSRASNLVYYSPMQYFRSPRAVMPHERAAPARISPWGDDHAAPLGGDRPSKASKAVR